MIENKEASSLLEAASLAYQRANTTYRASLLEVGRLLHEFILAFLKDGDGMDHRERQKAGCTREKAVEVAAESFGVTCVRINEIVAITQAANLLGKDGLGALAFWSILRFKSLIRRKGIMPDATGRWRGIASSAEEWEIKPAFAESGPALFRLAVAENWGYQRIRDEVHGLRHNRKELRPARRRAAAQKKGRSEIVTVDELVRLTSCGSPGDVAERCIAIVEKSEDPAAVALRLRVMLQKYLPKKSAV